MISEHSSISARWQLFLRAFLRAYVRLNRITHHMLSISLKLLALFGLLFALLVLILRYAVLPNIGNYKPELEQLLSSSLGRPVHIQQVIGSWQGLHPQLELQQVVIDDGQGRSVLTLPKIQMAVAWLSLVTAEVRLYQLEIDNPELELQRSTDGKIYIAGWWIDPQEKTDTHGLDWILSQRSIVINNGVLRWSDQQRNAPLLTLSNLNVVMKNRWRDHHFSLTATPPVELAGPLDIRADFTHHPFNENISDYTQWQGHLYAAFAKTDLAAWKPYLDYPFDLQQGAGGIRVWFAFNQAKLVNVTTDLKLTNVQVQLGADLKPLDLKNVSGRISVQEIVDADTKAMTIVERLRTYGHQIALTNFTFEARSGMRLPPTTLTERFVPATEQWQFTTALLDLTTLAKLTDYFPVPEEYRGLLNKLQPAGQLSQFSILLQGKYPELVRYQVKGGFTNLTLQAQKGLPGFANLSGKIDADEERGSLQLTSKNVTLQLPEYFAEPQMQLDEIDMKAHWATQANQDMLLTLSKLRLKQALMEANFYGTHRFKKTAVWDGDLDLTGAISQFELPHINRYLPLKTDSNLAHWLTHALEQGSLEDIHLRIKGNLADFPFKKKGLLDQNIFRVNANIVDGTVNYLPGEFGKDGVSPYWPLLSKIKGDITFDRETVEIKAESGETDGIPVAKVQIRIADILSDNLTLDIDGTANGKAQNILHYLSVSPLLEWTNLFSPDSMMTGAAKLTLKLNLPIFHPRDAKVIGAVRLSGNDIKLSKNSPWITQLKGQFDFDESGINVKTLKGNLLGGPITVTGSKQKDGVVRIKTEGQISADGLRKAYAQSELKNFFRQFDGKTAYSALVQVNQGQTEMWIDSTLQGMALRLPAPLNKTAEGNLPLHLEFTQPVVNTSMQQDEVKFSLGSAVKAHYWRQRALDAEDWQIVRGGVGVNAPIPTPDSGVSAYIDLASFNMDEFQSLWPGTANSPATPSAWYSHLEPDLVSFHVDELMWLGKKINHVVLGATRLNNIWQANIDSQQISGHLSWDHAERGLGHVTARLNSLIIPETAANDVVDLLQNKQIHSSIPGLDVTAESVELFGKKLGSLELHAKNVYTSNILTSNEWQINSLRVKNPDAELTAQGKWINDNDGITRTQTSLQYQLDLTDAGKLLARLGYPNVIDGGTGKLNGDIRWNGSPYALDLPSLAGQIQLDLHSGQFLKVEPGAAKLFAVLNLQSLPRRLILDFRDVFSEGFAFDGITGNAQVEKGIVKTDNFKMHSPSATVLLSGTADIIGETQDLQVLVVPEVNAGAASVVYGLAVNPVIGAGTFLAQLFLREPLMKAFTFEYHITGPWKEPNVTKLDNSERKE